MGSRAGQPARELLNTVSDEGTLCFETATDLVRRIRAREISCEQVMAAHLARIEAVNGALNAIVTLAPDTAMQAARAADKAVATGQALGPLHGLPIAHKDLAATKGMRTTFGSLVHQNYVPTEDCLLVQRLAQAGAICIGKTNTPEFGAGSQTFNEVFGVTRNPYDTRLTCGGSSGGGAVALAARMLPVADGSDMGGSLRNPAAFCNVVGLRPTPGTVPAWPTDLLFDPLPVEGPMARTAQDCALLLSAMAGPDPRAPNSRPTCGARYREPLQRDFRGTRIAFSADFEGTLPVEPQIAAVVRASEQVFTHLGCNIRRALPDFTHADNVFKVFRAHIYATLCASVYAQHKEMLKGTLVWNIEQGLQLDSAALGAAEKQRTALYQRMVAFMQEHEFALMPVTQVMPFDADQEYMTAVNGQPMQTYLDWMRSCYYVTATGHPAASVPCGFTDQGLPVGLQIVGRYGDDFGVLQLAHAFEQATGWWKHAPTLG